MLGNKQSQRVDIAILCSLHHMYTNSDGLEVVTSLFTAFFRPVRQLSLHVTLILEERDFRRTAKCEL